VNRPAGPFVWLQRSSSLLRTVLKTSRSRWNPGVFARLGPFADIFKAKIQEERDSAATPVMTVQNRKNPSW
jgi:hypothetical protein